ncbi:hypothetical protein GALL_318250 [mine drainage metagenome]|uniref:DUF3619 family protein n=1 Tax=mine drainage metagenome TaxID=410659 RepID=A0A1J5QRR0_9ZZZZ
MTQERDNVKEIIEILDHGASSLDEATIAKLASARRQAVAAMDGRARAVGVELADAGPGRFTTIRLSGRHAWMPILIALMIGLLLVLLVQKQAGSIRKPVEEDALLLASDLPPEAYVDKGFDAWLENSSQH